MNIEKQRCQQTSTTMCLNCDKFYASEVYQGLCSSCYKSSRKNSEELNFKAETPVTVQEEPKISQIKEDVKQMDRKRCFQCGKKVGLLGIQCRCGFVYCNGHRLPEEHECVFDHHSKGIEKLKKQIVKVYNGKITEI